VLPPRTENEKRSLIISVGGLSQQTPLTRVQIISRIQKDLRSTKLQFNVIYPFLTNEEALLKFDAADGKIQGHWSKVKVTIPIVVFDIVQAITFHRVHELE
jgi:hypothetical protein